MKAGQVSFVGFGVPIDRGGIQKGAKERRGVLLRREIRIPLYLGRHSVIVELMNPEPVPVPPDSPNLLDSE